MQIKVMTFNVRIDVPVDGDNQWRFRIPSVKAMIEKHQPDILMLQETTPAMLKDLEKIENVYGYYYVGRNADSQGKVVQFIIVNKIGVLNLPIRFG